MDFFHYLIKLPDFFFPLKNPARSPGVGNVRRRSIAPGCAGAGGKVVRGMVWLLRLMPSYVEQHGSSSFIDFLAWRWTADCQSLVEVFLKGFDGVLDLDVRRLCCGHVTVRRGLAVSFLAVRRRENERAAHVCYWLEQFCLIRCGSLERMAELGAGVGGRGPYWYNLCSLEMNSGVMNSSD